MPQHILCQTPTKGLLNLTYARQVQFGKIHIHKSWQMTCFIIWNNGERETFLGKDAEAISKTLKKFT